MGKQVKKSRSEISTIDCSLITIETAAGEFGFDTSNKLAVEPQVNEQEAVQLIVKGVLRAQKLGQTTITGHQLTITDNVFNAELVVALQGGNVVYDDDNVVQSYTPPLSGSKETRETFKVNGYSAQYDASGQIVRYEKITYPNCQGSPVAFSSEDGVFRTPEYVIKSAPKTGEAPFVLSYVKKLPTLVNEYNLEELTLVSFESSGIGTTVITVNPSKDEYSNKYFYKVGTSSSPVTLPVYGMILLSADGWVLWDGKTDIEATNGYSIAVVETDTDNKALAAGLTTVVAKTE